MAAAAPWVQESYRPDLPSQFVPQSIRQVSAEAPLEPNPTTEDALRQPLPVANQMSTYRFGAFDFLATLYLIRDPMAIKAFLRDHETLASVLFSAFPKINAFWGNQLSPELRLVEDADDESTSLVVYVASRQPDAYARLDRFDEEWWLDHIKETEGLLNFAIDSQ